MNQDFFERLINASCTAAGIGLASTLDPYYIAIGAFMVCMSFPDCLGYLTGSTDGYELVVNEVVNDEEST